MEPTGLDACSLHRAGAGPEHLIGRRVERVLTSWHLFGAEEPSGPLDLWLIDNAGICTHVTTGSDWCLLVETAAPFAGCDMGEWGRVVVAPDAGDTPIAEHVGKVVHAVREEWEAHTGRTALEITFDSGVVRCESWSGDLRLTSRKPWQRRRDLCDPLAMTD